MIVISDSLAIYSEMLDRSFAKKPTFGETPWNDSRSGWLSPARQLNALSGLFAPDKIVRTYETDELIVAVLHFAMYHIDKFYRDGTIFCPPLDEASIISNTVSSPIYRSKGFLTSPVFQGYEFDETPALSDAFKSSHEVASELTTRMAITISMGFPLGKEAGILAFALLCGHMRPPQRKKPTTKHRDTLFRAIANGIQNETNMALGANATAFLKGSDKPICASVLVLAALNAFRIPVDIHRAVKIVHGKEDNENNDLYRNLLRGPGILNELSDKALRHDRAYPAQMEAALTFLATPMR